MRLHTAVRYLVISTIISVLLYSISISQTEYWQSPQGPYTGGAGRPAFSKSGKIFVFGCKCSAFESPCYQSTDAGTTWQGNPRDGVFATTYDGSLYTAANGTLYAAAWDGKLYRSSDDGNSYQPISSPVTVNPVIFHIASSGMIAVAGFGGIVVSTDNGGTWRNTAPKRMRHTLSFLNITSNAKGYFMACDEHLNWWVSRGAHTWSHRAGLRGVMGVNAVANLQGHFFIVTYNGVVLRSVNNGLRWGKITEISTKDHPTEIGDDQVGSLSILPSGDLMVGMLGGRLIRVISAANWQQQLLYTFPSRVTGTASDSTGRIIIVTTAYDGVFRSSDAGVTWVQVGLKISSVWSFARTFGGNVFALSQYGRTAIYRSSDNGQTWALGERGLSFTSIFGGTSSGTLFAQVCCDYGVYRSTDNGLSWAILNDTVLPKGGIGSFYEIANGNVLAGAFAGVFRTTDNGDSWNKVFDGPAGIIIQGHDSNIYASAGGVIRSVDNGSTWTQVNNGLTDLAVRSLAQTSDNVLYATTKTGIFSSSDNGNTWSFLASGPQREDLVTILADAHDNLFVNAGSNVGYYDQNGGIFTSTDHGLSWTDISSGLPYNDIISMTLTSDGHLLVGGEHFGVFRSAAPTTGVAQFYSLPQNATPKEFSLSQNYPNPFNPGTQIRLEVPVLSHVTVKLYDVLGHEVAILLNEEKQPGVYNLQWDARHLASGTYFCRMNAGSFVQTRKLLLVR